MDISFWIKYINWIWKHNHKQSCIVIFRFGSLGQNKTPTKHCFWFSPKSYRWYITLRVKLCKVNFARGFLFEVVITEQVRSKTKEEICQWKRGLRQTKRKELLEEEGEERWVLWGHKIKRSSVYIFNLSYGFHGMI